MKQNREKTRPEKIIEAELRQKVYAGNEEGLAIQLKRLEKEIIKIQGKGKEIEEAFNWLNGYTEGLKAAGVITKEQESIIFEEAMYLQWIAKRKCKRMRE